jgi:aminoglycoside phosphotransferase (APT) family kinase protein
VVPSADLDGLAEHDDYPSSRGGMSADGRRRKVEAFLGQAAGREATLLTFEPLSGGACQDNWKLEVRWRGQDAVERYVLRSDAVRSLPGSIDRAQEFAVLELALARGVRTARVRWLARDLLRPGASSYVLDWVDGEALGRRLVKQPELAAARAGLARELAAELAKIHSIGPEDGRGLFTTGYNPDPSREPAEAALASARRMMDGLVEPHPVLELILRWLRERQPRNQEVVLVHGDFRTGNFLVTERGLAAVLDWEFAHWGTPAEDLAWICLRDWRFGALDRPAGGFASRAELYESYSAASGRAIDPEDVHWWEILENVVWALGCIYQGERYLTGAERDIELIAIARRSNEMEWEALRLIAAGPQP